MVANNDGKDNRFYNIFMNGGFEAAEIKYLVAAWRIIKAYQATQCTISNNGEIEKNKNGTIDVKKIVDEGALHPNDQRILRGLEKAIKLRPFNERSGEYYRLLGDLKTNKARVFEYADVAFE